MPDIWPEGVIPFIQAKANNVTFQQDIARPHVARVVRDYLTQQNVDVLPWPAVSPNLSAIKNVWDETASDVSGNGYGIDPYPTSIF